MTSPPEQKRVVVPLPTLPKNVIAVLTRVGELMDSSVSESYSSGARARKNRNGKLSKQQKRWIYLAQKLKPFLCNIEEGFYIAASSNREDTKDQKTEEFTHGGNFRHYV